MRLSGTLRRLYASPAELGARLLEAFEDLRNSVPVATSAAADGDAPADADAAAAALAALETAGWPTAGWSAAEIEVARRALAAPTGADGGGRRRASSCSAAIVD